MYACYWQGNKVIVSAATSYYAQQLAEIEFRKASGRKKVVRSLITVMLAVKDGEEVIHDPAILGS